MCHAHVAAVVRQRLQKEGRRFHSRRNFLKFGGLATAGLALGAHLPATLARAQDAREVIDLTHVFTTNPPTYVLGAVPSKEVLVTVENDGFYMQQWTFGEHTGTHLDIPAHFAADGETVENYPADVFIAPAVVIDIAARAEEDPDAMVTVDDLLAWESANGEIPEGALVCMYSGWESRWEDVEAFRNADEDGVMHFPGFSGEAAQWLLDERNINGIGVDTLSLDIGPSTTFDVHLTVLPAGKYGIENLKNLADIKGRNATLFVGIPRYEAGSGGPCRVLALV